MAQASQQQLVAAFMAELVGLRYYAGELSHQLQEAGEPGACGRGDRHADLPGAACSGFGAGNADVADGDRVQLAREPDNPVDHKCVPIRQPGWAGCLQGADPARWLTDPDRLPPLAAITGHSPPPHPLARPHIAAPSA
jgi:hypothetical protein